MAKYDPNTREQIIQLSDGRQLFKTHKLKKLMSQTHLTHLQLMLNN